MTSLFLLSMNTNRLGGPVPECIGNLSLAITTLALGLNPITGEIPRAMGNLVNLEILHVTNNILSGAIPFDVENLPNLTYVDLSTNNLSGVISSSFHKNKRLIALYLDGNHFHGHIPSHLDECQSLTMLDLSNNNLSGSAFPVVKTLLYLNLFDNHLNGSLPVEVGKIEHINSLDISSNMFSGEIPSTLGVVLVLVFVYACWLKKKKVQQPTLSSIADTWQNLSYSTLFKATDGFSSTNLIGVGSFGSVYRGLLQENETYVAVKVLNLTRHGALKSFKTECEALKHIKHRNLLKVLTVCSGTDYNRNDFKALVYEFMINEYGIGSAVSIRGDVYSYGILLQEMFTGIRHTAEIFKENLNLHIFIEEALPERVLEITDPILIREMESYAGESRSSTVQDCLLMVYGIGIACSVGVPGERMSITDVAAQLCSITDILYAAGLRE
ncbi:putative receptor-like protein kinase At3g47110 [Rhodamnia argentea]|uniref:Receptor-like protein kinase At3g47110 n=1 Tax=Rhodamnia argentea TaxID=178133 RepID=A0ABM3HE90_9MYRT|nr:putative receptor-like protein kinase At3g47110 [Rhodamnia argentea]